jgi:hypothetical protein
MIDDVINRLRASSFLGIEVGNDVFSYSDDGLDGKKSDILARKLSETERREIRFVVHPAYRSFLEIVDVAE